MLKTMLEGLSLIDATGLTVLAITIATLVVGIVLNFWARSRYAAIEKDLLSAREPGDSFVEPVLKRIVDAATDAARRAEEPNTQAIIEDRFQADLKPLLFAERFVRSSTGLVIILGLLGTFYGLTLSIGRIVHLVAADTTAAVDISQGVSQGLTHALSGMAVAFSNSLVGVLAAVLLTLVGILSNISDRRTSVMVQIETYLDRALARSGDAATRLVPAGTGLGDSVARLEGVVTRFESSLQGFAANTRDFREFNAHLKDNVQRMSLAFADLSETLKAYVSALRPGPRG